MTDPSGRCASTPCQGRNAVCSLSTVTRSSDQLFCGFTVMVATAGVLECYREQQDTRMDAWTIWDNLVVG